ncbi:MAG: endonuclease MutS2 [Rhodothermales bacterium]
MVLYPASLESALGFDVLRDRLIEHAMSSAGADRLAAMRPLRGEEATRNALARVAEYLDALRYDDRIPFDAVPDVREGLQQIGPAGAYLEPETLLDVWRVLSVMRLVRQYFIQRKDKYPMLAREAEALCALPQVEQRLREIVDDEGRIREHASPELRRIRDRLARRQAQLREAMQQALRKAIGQGYSTEEQPTIRGGRMVIPVRVEAKRKIDGFVHDVSATGQTVYIEPADCLDLNNDVRSLEAEERREIIRILQEATDLLREHQAPLRAGLGELAAFDTIQARARLARAMDASVPELNTAGVVDIRGGRNPVLALRFAQPGPQEAAREVIPLNLQLGEAFNTLLITGPNAGGKTVALKTVGLFALMIAYGMPLPAHPSTRFALFSNLFVDIGDGQSIEDDLSTFSSHIANLHHMLQHAGASTLILIDEAGTGTDPAEGGALAQAVLETLTRKQARTIATTHHGSLKAFAHETPGVENGSMQFDQETLEPTYVFQAGIPGSSYAFSIAERRGLDVDVLERARDLVGREKTNLEDLINTLERRTVSLEHQLRDAEAAAGLARAEEAKYRQLHQRLQDQKEVIKEQALEAAEQVIQKANAQVERTIREIKESQAARDVTRQVRAELDALKETVQVQKQQVKKRRPPRPKPSPAQEAAGPLTVGDQVVLDGGNTTADLLEIDGKQAVIMAGSMHLRVDLKRLTKVAGPRRQQVTVRHVAADPMQMSAVRARQRIDLRGRRVDEALAETSRFIDEAIAANLNRVEILHGKGTGALRAAIHEYLNQTPEVTRYEDASWDDGGPGVTQVHFA